MSKPDLPIGEHIARQFDGHYQYLSRKYNLIQKAALDGMFPCSWYEIGDIDRAMDILLEENPHHDTHSPYWCVSWPSAYTLAAFLCREEASFSDMRVLDLGCGPGITGVAAGFCDAQEVVFSDYAADALRLAAINWMLCHKSVPSLLHGDWRSFPADGQKYDVLLASDVAYESGVFHSLISLFDSILTPAGHILLAEPNRPFSQAFFEMLRENQFTCRQLLTEPARNGQAMEISVYDIGRES